MKKVLAIGNSLVDVLIRIQDEQILTDLGLAKGSMTLVDRQKMSDIFSRVESFNKTRSSGGSAANTINGLNQLGVPSGFIGKTGKDEFGDFFRLDMENAKTNTHISHGNDETGRVIVLITEDSERTFATYLGASVELSPSDIKAAYFKGYDFFHIEGYLIHNRPLIEKCLQLAKDANLKISFDLASYGVVEANIDFLHDIIEKYVDIVFANEEEAAAFTNKQDPLAALNMLGEYCQTAIVKIGSRGSLILDNNKLDKIAPVAANAVDTTGAGDLYASGFLFGLARGYPNQICGRIASIVSGKVVEVIGAKMSNSQWREIKAAIDQINVGP